ncbi:MAG: hypothetical protein CL779_02270 [Chloroflexi bacterium]|nr:hypothetical protein [Chloroflexota bacterium]|tara:strand:- start:1258 stop:2073 length:816 start_codon:yes stop_codon:yes gene_type:complete
MKKTIWSSKARLKNSKKPPVKRNKIQNRNRQFEQLKNNLLTSTNIFLFITIIFTISFFSIRFADKYLSVSTITFNHSTGVLADELKKSIKLEGSTLFFMNTDKIEKQLLNNPEVESVKIMKKWPNQLIIDLKIYKAALQIKKENEKYFINNDGKQINYYESNSIIPLLHLSQETNFSDLNPKINIDFINSINFINEYDLNKKMKMNNWNYVYNKNTGISVHINERQRIILGNSDQLEFKLNNLQKVFSTIMLEKIDFKEIDLRYNSKIVLR